MCNLNNSITYKKTIYFIYLFYLFIILLHIYQFCWQEGQNAHTQTLNEMVAIQVERDKQKQAVLDANKVCQICVCESVSELSFLLLCENTVSEILRKS